MGVSQISFRNPEIVRGQHMCFSSGPAHISSVITGPLFGSQPLSSCCDVRRMPSNSDVTCLVVLAVLKRTAPNYNEACARSCQRYLRVPSPVFPKFGIHGTCLDSEFYIQNFKEASQLSINTMKNES
ncbi:Equilibrative Nucleoside Transporter 3 [Manis pentadactyla]|nr:Equilibrative Nucleoside Transporter 3 [Manis pentadactyla]